MREKIIHKPHYDKVKRQIKVLGYTAIPGLTIRPIEFDSVSQVKTLAKEVCKIAAEIMEVDIKELNKAINAKKGITKRRKNSTQDVSDAMHYSIFITHHISLVSFHKIGQVFGFRDHSTIIHAKKKVEGICEIYVSQRGVINSILHRMGYPQLPASKWKLR